MDITDADRTELGRRVAEERRRQFATRSAAYKAADINPATWTRIESGQVVREDRLIAAVKTLWPHSGGDWRKIGPRVLEYGGPSAAHSARTPESRAEVIRRSIQGHPDEHPEFDEWMATVDLRLQIQDVRTGAVPRPTLIERDVSTVRNALAHHVFSDDSDAAATRLLVDYASDLERPRAELDHRARLLAAYGRAGQSSAHLVDAIDRYVGDLDPDVDPTTPTVDLAHPVSGEVTVELSGPVPETTAGDRALRQGRSR